jgi:hypothetical protein
MLANSLLPQGSPKSEEIMAQRKRRTAARPRKATKRKRAVARSKSAPRKTAKRGAGKAKKRTTVAKAKRVPRKAAPAAKKVARRKAPAPRKRPEATEEASPVVIVGYSQMTISEPVVIEAEIEDEGTAVDLGIRRE